jgi:hypothetical protein
MATPSVRPNTTAQPSTPDYSVLMVPSDQVLLFKARAQGFQIYPCDPQTKTFGAAHPEAILTTDKGHLIHHFTGPTWQAADGSLVVGTVLQKVPSPDPDAIPWLLLSTKPGGAPDGMLSAVTFIQRLYTKHGNPPSGPCGADGSSETPVLYEAEYYFYALRDCIS